MAHMEETESHPLLEPRDEDDDPSDEPPAYLETPVWSNSRPVGEGVVVNSDGTLTSVTVQPHEQPSQIPSADATPATGPMRVEVRRSSGGFGFSIRGDAPVEVVYVDPSGPAIAQGIKPGFKILEVEGVDVTTSSLDVVSGLIQAASDPLHMVVIPAAPESQERWQNPFEVFGINTAPAHDPTSAPPTNFLFSFMSLFCCPLIGVMAIYNSILSRIAWNARRPQEAQTRSMMARKLASSATFYGTAFLVLYLFIHAGREDSDSDNSSW